MEGMMSETKSTGKGPLIDAAQKGVRIMDLKLLPEEFVLIEEREMFCLRCKTVEAFREFGQTKVDGGNRLFISGTCGLIYEVWESLDVLLADAEHQRRLHGGETKK